MARLSKEDKERFAFHKKCRLAAEALAKVAPKADHDRIEEYADDVIAAFSGDVAVFWQLDEKPGAWGGYGGYPGGGYIGCLRRVRNSPVHGKRLFASFRQ